jgi:hypothetical protein
LGTFEKSYEVDGKKFELYRQESEGEHVFQLVDGDSAPVGQPFAEVPSDAAIAEFVTATDVPEAA